MDTFPLKLKENWQKIGVKNHHGINTPLFSLKTRRSCGIGEYLDLIPLIDFCHKIQFDIIQLLPLNDTGNDPSPYNALSSLALHPIYLSLYALPNLDSYKVLAQELLTFKTLNEEKNLNYREVHAKKIAFLRKYFEKEFISISNQNDYREFINKNYWLNPYAEFKCLKMKFDWKNWQDWPKCFEFSKDDPEFQFQIFLQYLCFRQMKEVKVYAEQRGIFLKGDLPILISPDAADVWAQQNLFLLNYSAGAPPDMYSSEGQNWGFPLYNWKEMEKENFGFWKERLETSTLLYHIYRLDHIVGFFRIWAFPAGEGTGGKFIPEDPKEWIPQGEKILRNLLSFSPLLPIGEDLGVVPPEVRLCMQRLGICGTKVMRWERKWNEDKSFISPKDYIPESMTTVSTHDSDTLRLWWQNSPLEAKEYAKSVGWDYSPELSHQGLKFILKESHHSGSLFHINLLQEYLDLFENYTWPNLSDERINIPGSQSDRNWNFRYKAYLEEMMEDSKLEHTMKELIA